MVLKRGIPAKDLRPFSIDDPYGLGVTSPSQERLRQRFRRKTAQRVAASAASQVAHQVVREASQKRPPSPKKGRPVPRHQAAQTKEKKKSGGCLTVLVVIGALYGLGTAFIPPIVNRVEQEIVIQMGNGAHGRIISANATGNDLFEEEIFELVVEVHVPGYDPYQVELEQALPIEQARYAKAGAWAELRYDPDKMTSIALISLGIPNPQLDLPEGSTPDVLPKTDEILDERSQEDGTAQAIPGDRVVRPPPPRQIPKPPRRPNTPIEPQNPSAVNPGTVKEPVAGEETATPQPEKPVPTTEKAKAPEPAPSPKPTPLVCRQAKACCQIAGGGACNSFTQTGVRKKKCRQALRGFSKLAKAAGKSCSGIP